MATTTCDHSQRNPHYKLGYLSEAARQYLNAVERGYSVISIEACRVTLQNALRVADMDCTACDSAPPSAADAQSACPWTTKDDTVTWKAQSKLYDFGSAVTTKDLYKFAVDYQANGSVDFTVTVECSTAREGITPAPVPCAVHAPCAWDDEDDAAGAQETGR